KLGLKLEKRPVPTPVLIVDSAAQDPTPDPPGVAEALPPPQYPAAFDVASLKPSEPLPAGAPLPRGGGATFSANGRFTAANNYLNSLIYRAFGVNTQEVLGIPAFANRDRYDIVARVAIPPGINFTDPDLSRRLVLALLEDRFHLKYHREPHPLPAYDLVAVKPKLKKADPASRTHCWQGGSPAGSVHGNYTVTCQNVTMPQFAEQLLLLAPALQLPIHDATGIEGAFDVELIYDSNAGRIANSQAADPSGGYTILEALEKEFGLKLEKVQRNGDVIVIDHL